LEIDEFWTYARKKEHKGWLIYAYCRETGEIVAHVWGWRDIKTVEKLKKKLKSLGVSCGSVAADAWESFTASFKEDKHLAGKRYTKGTEGNNCRLRHRSGGHFGGRAAMPKKLVCHLKAFDMVFFTSITALFEGDHTFLHTSDCFPFYLFT
jgi:IS1 family transposase